MSDWPRCLLTTPQYGTIHSGGLGSLQSIHLAIAGLNFSVAAAWPAANRALYTPFLIETTVTAYKMAFEVGAQAGNCDVGIYDELGNRLVSKGSTAVGAAGLQVIDIADTVLTPGVYYMAMNVDTTTTLTIARVNPQVLLTQVGGMQQQAVGAVTLPNPAVFANPASAYIPSMSVAFKVTI